MIVSEGSPQSADTLGKIAAEDAAAARADAAERIKIQASLADALLKALMLANGGAMVALFTFIGNIVARSAIGVPFDRSKLWTSFACFVAGLTLALLCHFAAFWSQHCFYNQTMREVWRNQIASHRGEATTFSNEEASLYSQGQLAYFVGLAMAVLSVVAFATGAGFALSGVLI